jgi:hypothetical protein
MDIPWMTYEQSSNQAASPAGPAGAKARLQSEAEALADRRSNWASSQKETCLTAAETDFEEVGAKQP